MAKRKHKRSFGRKVGGCVGSKVKKGMSSARVVKITRKCFKKAGGKGRAITHRHHRKHR